MNEPIRVTATPKSHPGMTRLARVLLRIVAEQDQKAKSAKQAGQK